MIEYLCITISIGILLFLSHYISSRMCYVQFSLVKVKEGEEIGDWVEKLLIEAQCVCVLNVQQLSRMTFCCNVCDSL